jgi:hypothetical protein
VCYGFSPDTLHREDTSVATTKKREFYLMLDLNRLVYMTSPIVCSKVYVKSKFQTMLVQMMRIEPEAVRTESELDILRENDEQTRQDMLKFEKHDTGLSRNEERFALVFATLMNLNQIRALLYYRLLKVMVIVGHNDIECAFLMPHDVSRVTGILSDDYYRGLIEKHAPKVTRRRQKVIKYLKDSFEVF